MSRTMTGTVVSDAQDKTIVVRVERSIQHPIYKKHYTVSKKYHVHDEANKAKVNDVVEFESSRPISKQKRWKMTSIVEEAAS